MSDVTQQPMKHLNRLADFTRRERALAAATPDVSTAFWNLHKSSVAPNALDRKTKELIALAIGVATHCEDCIAHHAKDACDAGARREEVADALAVAILMGGGTGVVYASLALEAFDQFTEGH